MLTFLYFRERTVQIENMSVYLGYGRDVFVCFSCVLLSTNSISYATREMSEVPD